MITPIERLGGISTLQQAGAVPSETQADGGSMFASIFQSAIQNVKDTNAENVQAQYLLSTGQVDNPASVMIAATKYAISVDMLVQLRNRAMDAYSEITRMSF